MAVVIRLRRGGKKKKPFYRIVATDSRFPRDGRFLEIIGQYNPIPDAEMINFDREKMLYWLGVGALPSDTVKSLLQKNGYWKPLLEELENKKKANIEAPAVQEVPVEKVEAEPQTES